MILVEAAAIFIAAVLLTALSSAWIARRLGGCYWDLCLVVCGMCLLTLCCTQQTPNPGAGIGGTWGVLPFLALPVSIGFVEDASNVDAYQGHMFKGKNSAIIVMLVDSILTRRLCCQAVAPTIFAAQLALLPWYATPARLPSNWSPVAVIACTMALSSTVGVVATGASVCGRPTVSSSTTSSHAGLTSLHHAVCRRSPWTLQLRHHPH